MLGPGPRMGRPRMGGPRHDRPIHGLYPMMHHQRRYSYLGTGLSALVGSAVGTTIVNNISNAKKNNNNCYEVFSYCPNCGTKRDGNSTNCCSCGISLIKG